LLIAAKNLAEVQKTPQNLQIKLIEGNLGYFICTENQKNQTEKEVSHYVHQINISKSLSVVNFKSKNPFLSNGD